MQGELKQKKEKFAVSIRREARNNIIRNLRNQYLQVIPEKYTYNGLVKHFDLDNDLNFIEQNIDQDPYILVRILLAKQENLIRITFKNSSNPQMIDQKLLPHQNSQFELEEVPLPKQYSFALQGSLFQTITQQIERDSLKYKQMPKEMQKQLINFLIDYMKRNTYFETAKEYDYHRVLINFMEFFVSTIESPDLRDRIIRWVSGTDGFKLISYCLTGSFMRYKRYVRLYKLILKGLRHNKIEVKCEAIHVLLKSIQNSDYDEIKEILDQIPQIYKELITYVVKMHENDANQFFANQQEILQSAKEAGRCVLAFLDTYEAQIFKCVEEGAGYVAGWLIIQNESQLIKIGLTILNYIGDLQKQNVKKTAMNIVFNGDSIRNLQVWKRLGQSYDIVGHENMEIRSLFVGFVTRVTSNMELQQIQRMNLLFRFPQNENLVEILIRMFMDNQNITIRHQILQCFQAICYYGEQIQVILQDKQCDSRNQMGLDTLATNYLLERIDSYGMKNLMEDIHMKMSPETVGRQNNDKLVEFDKLIGLFIDFIHDNQQDYID